MALLGFHLVLTLIMLTILQKFTSRFSFARRILTNGLYRYLPPSVQELKDIVSGGVGSGKARRRRNDRETNDADGFLVPKSAVIQLDKLDIKPIEIVALPLCNTFCWLIDLCAMALIVYAISEVYASFWLSSSNETNMSIIWLLVVVSYCLHSLTKLTSGLVSAQTDDVAERNILVCFAAFYFLSSMAMLMFADVIFDTSFLAGYTNLTESAKLFLESQQLSVLHSDRSPIVLYVFFALLFGILSAMLVFPNFRYAKMYTIAVKYADENAMLRLLLHVTFLFPLLCLVLWTHPVKQYLLFGPRKLLNEDQLNSIRIISVLIAVLLRYVTIGAHLQAHLNLAYERMNELKHETGRINSIELQRMIFRYFSYLCAAALQYTVPIILPLIFALLLKTLGDYSWMDSFEPYRQLLQWLPTSSSPSSSPNREYSLASASVLMNVTVNRGLWSFVLVTTMAVNFSLSLLGVVYGFYFQHA